MSDRRPVVHLVTLALATALALNPVALFLLSGQAAGSIAGAGFSVALVVGLAVQRRRTAVAVVVFNLLVLVSVLLHAERSLAA